MCTVWAVQKYAPGTEPMRTVATGTKSRVLRANSSEMCMRTL